MVTEKGDEIKRIMTNEIYRILYLNCLTTMITKPWHHICITCLDLRTPSHSISSRTKCTAAQQLESSLLMRWQNDFLQIQRNKSTTSNKCLLYKLNEKKTLCRGGWEFLNYIWLTDKYSTLKCELKRWCLEILMSFLLLDITRQIYLCFLNAAEKDMKRIKWINIAVFFFSFYKH